ncbi:endonuclease/exonuclease/phosphatase family protein [Aeoliella sp. ICT_H6.2]|uniref:Endonuclease/exonuclease/phosphatase family protein n=1 Tax=Aeoliella straminimaris TaxID=2954799 RepID=A0A9X2FI03_9BACT|nr:endonuclease/exonuclease/phosphatase family protein [Aeoliella straminimaris]MCO6047329.1 endonuclease/exonuclease/phosphatase family protein [Aeoliella straminimaris]
MLVKLLTYNIHKGIGGIDRKYRLERVMDVLRHHDPDIALLQEVDEGVPRSRGDRQVELLREELGYADSAFQANVRLRQGHYGNAILSRFPLSQKSDIDLTVRPKKRRRALVAHARLASGQHTRTLVVASLHLGLADFERRIQLRRLLQHDAIAHHHGNTPMIVGGDFNDVWGRLGKRLMLPGGFQAASGKVRTFPARLPLRALDAIYFRGDIALDHAFAGSTQLCREASDHRPLVAHLNVQVG